MTTVITGEVEPDETIKLISKYFHSDRKPPQATVHEELKPIQKTVREDIISDKASATSIIIGFNGPANNRVKEKVYLDALESLLAGSRTSRIDSKLKRFNTAAWMSEEKISTKPTDGRAVTIAVETTEENSEKVLKTVFNEVRGLQLNPPTGEEMQIIKKQMIKNLSSVFEQSFTTNSAIGNAFMDNSPEWLNDYEKIVNSMTANDLVEFSKKYLNLNKAAITVVHPSGSDVRSISQNYAAAVSFSGKTAKKQALDVEKVTEYQFANNVRLVINDIPTRNSRMSVQLKCKKKFEAQPAAYFVLDRMLNEGCAAKTEQEFAKELQKDGISQYFSSGSKDISAQSSFDVTDTAKALQAFKEVLYNPRFKEDAFVQAKNDIKEELLMSEKSVDKNINRELFKGTIAGYSNNEILESLNTLTMQEVEDLYSHIINNAQAKVVISAPLSKQPELFNTIVSELNLMKPAQPGEFIRGGKFKPVEETKVITESDNKNQANIIQAYKFEINHNLKDAVTVELLSTILGGGPSSRLFNDLREQQKLAYRVRSGGSLNGRTGTIKLAIGTTTENFDTGEVSYDNVQKSIEGFKKHINKLINEKVTGEELQNAKLSMKNDILSGNESTSGKTHALLKGMTTIYGISRENQKLEIIDQITADDIQNAAKYIFSGKPTYSIVATENTLKHNEEYLNLLKKPGI
jgi:predicted Zn-dependent peptidase